MFHKCYTQEEARVMFRRLAKFLHPDMGGDTELFILLQEAKEQWDESFRFGPGPDNHFIKEESKKHKKNKFDKKERPGVYQEVNDDVIYLDDRLDIIEEIVFYGKKTPSFNMDYTNNVKKHLDEKGFVTPYQYHSLLNIYYGFKMQNNPYFAKKREAESGKK